MARSLEEIELAFRAKQNEKVEAEVEAEAKVEAEDCLTRKIRAKQIKAKLLMILCFLIGMTIFIYPPLSDYLARRNVATGANTYEKQVINLSKEEIERMWEEAETYNASLNGDPVPDPFVPGSGRILPDNYLKVLDTGNGTMGFIDIPKIKVYLPINHGSSEEVLTKGAGHIEQTTLPIGGIGNLSVITAHTGYSGAEMFDRLIQIVNGDIFVVRVLDKVLTYKVDDIRIIDPEDLESLLPIAGKDYVTLVTCTPYGVNSHRLLVRGERVPNVPETMQRNTETPFPWKLIIMAVASIITFILILVLNDRRNKKKQARLKHEGKCERK